MRKAGKQSQWRDAESFTDSNGADRFLKIRTAGIYVQQVEFDHSFLPARPAMLKLLKYLPRPFRRLIMRFSMWAIDRLLEETEENAYWIVRRGWLRFISGDCNGAVSDFSTAIEFVPDYGDAYRLRAAAYWYMYENELALQDIQEDLRLRPLNAETRSVYGNILRQMGDEAEAIREYQRALDLDPDNASAYTGLGHYHFDRGNWGLAVENYERAFALGAIDPEARVFLVKAREHLQMVTQNA